MVRDTGKAVGAEKAGKKKREGLHLAARWKAIYKPGLKEVAGDAAFVMGAAAVTAVCTYLIDQAMQAAVTFAALQFWF